MEKVGKYAFIFGVLVAVIAGVTELSWAPVALAVFGIVVGFLNVTGEESQSFLLAAIGLIMTATALDSIPEIGEAISPFVTNLVAFIGAAVFVVALKTILEVARD